tara:strand:- start:13677 stop:14207 length:531 start_codon:yes stop_codon:yes gene_type:complete
MKASRNPRLNLTVGFSTLWLLFFLLFISTNWVTYEAFHHPPIQDGTQWNNYWLTGGQFRWTYFDPVNTKYIQTYSPPTLKLKAYSTSDTHWGWWFGKGAVSGGRYFHFPLWILLLPMLFVGPLQLVLLSNQKYKQCRWQRKGLCTGCGYQMLSNKSRCPECGHEPAQLHPIDSSEN